MRNSICLRLYLLLSVQVGVSCGKSTQFASSAISTHQASPSSEQIPKKEDDDIVATPETKTLPPSLPDFIVTSEPPAVLPQLAISQLPVAVINGQPTGETSVDQIGITVTGENLVGYDYVVVSGTQPCSSLSNLLHNTASQSLTASTVSMPEGPIKVCVWGENAKGEKQLIATEASWTKKYQSCGAASNGVSESRIVYQNAAVPFGQNCIPATQERVCNNGSWSGWSGSSFLQTSCVVASAASCGATPHNGSESRTVYESDSVPFGSNCNAGTQTRTCQNGVFGSWSGSTFQQTACVVKGASSCGLTPHNGTETRTVYASATVNFGSACVPESQTRTCQNGVFSAWGGSTASNLTCVVAAPLNCGSTPHQGTENRTVYQSQSVPFGASCVSGTQTRTCTNGSFSAWSGSSFANTSCSVSPAASCGPTPHNGTETRTVYQSASVPFGSSCVSGTQTRSCNNGSLSSWSGSSYSNLTCSAQPNSAPTLNSIPSQTVIKRILSSQAFSIQLAGSDIDGNLLGYRVVAINPVVSYTLSSTGLFEINNANLPSGPSTLTISFEAFDEAGAKSATRTATVSVQPDRETVEVVPGTEVSITKNGSGSASCPTNKFGIAIRSTFQHADTLVCASLRTKSTRTNLTWGAAVSSSSMSHAGAMASCTSGFSITGSVTRISGSSALVQTVDCRAVTAAGFVNALGSPQELSIVYTNAPANCASNYAPALYGAGSPVTADWVFDRAWCVEWLMLR